MRTITLKSEGYVKTAIFFQGGNGPQVHEEMFSTNNQQGNTNQNHNEISSHPGNINYCQQDKRKSEVFLRDGRNLIHCWYPLLLAGIKAGMALS